MTDLRDRLKGLFSRVYDVLVEMCVAQDTDYARFSFVFAMTEKEHPVTEYRFGGKLGEGGKFWMPSFTVSYYHPEHDTPERRELVLRTNAALRALRDEYEALED
jgi:hypothetical protein